jgi:hypothetical protein
MSSKTTEPEGPGSPADVGPPTWRFWLPFGLGLVAFGALAFWAGTQQNVWARVFIFWPLSAFLALYGLLFLTEPLPSGHLKDVIQAVIGMPCNLLATAIEFVGAAGHLAFCGYVLVEAQALVWTLLWTYVVRSPTDVPGAALYLSAVGTLAIAAYRPTSLLAPARVILRLKKRRRGPNAYPTLVAPEALLTRLNPRRLAYQLTIGVYLLSVALRLAGVSLGEPLGLIATISLETLLTFIALDAYLATFHPQLLTKAAGAP